MPRCKNCREKFEAKHFNQKYCFDSECVKVWVKSAKDKNWKKEKKELKEQLETVQSLTKKAQTYFNTYIRARDNHKTCVSCDKPLGAKCAWAVRLLQSASSCKPAQLSNRNRAKNRRRGAYGIA